jgi:putative ABC transport system permease protein
LTEVENEIEKIWPVSFPGKALNMRSAAQSIADNYADDLRYARVLAAVSALAIVIAAFGVYVLSAYSVQRRTREFVLCKLYGAQPSTIARLVLREFGWLLGASALIGLPLALLARSRYLGEFVEHAPMGDWPLILGLVLAVVVAVCATLRQVRIAMSLSPLAALAG